jgi:hypothetical protein
MQNGCPENAVAKGKMTAEHELEISGAAARNRQSEMPARRSEVLENPRPSAGNSKPAAFISQETNTGRASET